MTPAEYVTHADCRPLCRTCYDYRHTARLRGVPPNPRWPSEVQYPTPRLPRGLRNRPRGFPARPRGDPVSLVPLQASSLWKKDDLVFRKFQRAKVPGSIRSGERKFQGARRPGSESSREREGEGAKRPGSESSREREGQGAKVPGSELARVPLADSLQGANWPGSEKAVNHNYTVRLTI